jgi:hypothetical protein
MVFNTSISAISWWSILMLEETRVPGDYDCPVVSCGIPRFVSFTIKPINNIGYAIVLSMLMVSIIFAVVCGFFEWKGGHIYSVK